MPRRASPIESVRFRGATFRVGQAVLVNPAEEEKSQAYIAQIKEIEPPPRRKRRSSEDGGRTVSGDDGHAATPGGAHGTATPRGAAAGDDDSAPEDTRLRVRWYYRPEETYGGRRPFQAVRELLMSDHEDRVFLGSLIRGARVLSLADFARAVPPSRRRLDPTPGARGRPPGTSGGGAAGAPFVEEEVPTYFARMSYRPAAKPPTFVPERLPVFCTCESAYCPDDAPAMISCPRCHEFFHPQCVGVSANAAERIRRELGLPDDSADVGAPPPRELPPDAPPPWLCPQCASGRSGGGGKGGGSART